MFFKAAVVNRFSIIFAILIALTCLEVLSIIFVVDPEEDSKVLCSKENRDPYIKSDQCFSSQEEIAKMEYDTFIAYIPAASYRGNGWYTNNNHFRYDENFNKEKPKNELRIFITGGSTAWGAGHNY